MLTGEPGWGANGGLHCGSQTLCMTDKPFCGHATKSHTTSALASERGRYLFARTQQVTNLVANVQDS